MSTRHIASSTLWQIGSQAAMAALSIITVKMVAIGLSKELAGNYNSAYGFLQIFGILADFGLYAVAVREVSKAEDKPKVMGTLIILRTIILLLSLLSALAFVWLIPSWRGTPFPIGVTIASLVPFFTLLAGIQRTIFQVAYKMHYVFIAEVTQRIVTVAIIAGIVLTGVRQSYDIGIYQWFLYAGGVGALVLFLFSTIFAQRLMRVDFSWDKELMKTILKKSLPFGLAFLFTTLYRQMDITLIALLRDDFEVQNAYYGFAMRAVEMAYLIPTFLLNSTLPILSKRDEEGEDTRNFVGTIFFAILLLGFTAFAYSFTWGRPLMALLTTENYLSTASTPGSDTALSLLGFSMLLNGVVLFCFYSMLTKHAWKPLCATLGLGAAFSIGLNIMLIPRLGFVGAAYSSIFTHLFLALTLLPQALSILPMHLDALKIRQMMGYCLILFLALFMVSPLLTSNLSTVLALLLSFVLLAVLADRLGIRKSLKV